MLTFGCQLCAAPNCPNSPELHRRSGRFCSTHVQLHEVCGVVGCGRPRSDDGEEHPSEACDASEHQELWLRFLRGREQVRARGWRGRQGARKVKKEATDVLVTLKLEASDEDGEDADEGRTSRRGAPPCDSAYTASLIVHIRSLDDVDIQAQQDAPDARRSLRRSSRLDNLRGRRDARLRDRLPLDRPRAVVPGRHFYD